MLRPSLLVKPQTLQLISKRYISFPKPSLAKLKPDFSKYKLKEQPPGYIVGSVNDAVPALPYDAFHGSYHWSYERAIAVCLVPLGITPFVAGVDMPAVDAAFSTLLLMHAHIGFTSCITDYIPKRVYGIWNTYAMRLLALGTVLGLYGVYVMETTDEGLCSLVKKLWEKPEEDEYLIRPRY